MQRFILYIISLFALILLQEFVLAHLSTGSYVAIYVYAMMVIMCDLDIRGWMLLALGFVTGWTADYFEGTQGLFAITLTWIAFLRPGIARWTLGREATQNEGIPTPAKVGNKRFITYLVIMVTLWAVPFFLLEAFGSIHWLYTTIKIILSIVATSFLIYLLQLPLNKKLNV